MHKTQQKARRQARTRGKIQGSQKRPRVSIFRSNQHIYVQVIDDLSGKVLFGLSDQSIENPGKGVKTERAKQLGIALAKKAKEKKIMTIIFDKGSYAYHGRVKAVAEGAREGGLQF